MHGVRTTSAAQALAEARGPATDDPDVLAVYDRQRDVRGFEAALREARWHRDEAVRQAVRAGVTRQAICQVTGLALSRISQITHHRR